MPYSYVNGKPVYYREGTPPPSAAIPGGASGATVTTQQPDPRLDALVKLIIARLGGPAPGSQALSGLNQFLANPLQNSAFSALIAPVLAMQTQFEQQARTALADQFRAAGASRSGAAAREAGNLEGDLATRRGALVSQMYPHLASLQLQALGQMMGAEQMGLDPLKIATQLAVGLRPASLTEALYGTAGSRGVSGGGGGGGESSMDIWNDWNAWSPVSRMVQAQNLATSKRWAE